MPSVTRAITPYRMDIRQGNFVTQEMVSQLKQGMTRDQVRFILGTPLINDIFHADRWDYIYRFAPGRGQTQERRLAVYFQDDRLVRVTGDVVAAGDAADAPAQASSGESRNRVVEIGTPRSAEKAGEGKPATTEPASAGPR